MKKLFLLCISIAAVLPGVVSARAADSYGDYPDPEAMYAEIYALADEHPGWVEVGEYGKSARGRALLYVKISRPGAENPAQAMLAANIHGNEWIGNRAAMAVARRLLEGADSDPWIKSILDHVEFYILPCLNPDGYYRTWEERNEKRAGWAEMRKNANGVDPNRNFPLPGRRTVDDGLAGSNDPSHERYTGPYPYSEPETAAIRDFVADKNFFAAIDFHSAWGTFFPPKCNGASCEKLFRKMMDAAIEKQGVKYVTGMSWQIDSFSGEMEDALFYDYGIMAVCWEIFPEGYASEQKKRHAHQFWSMNPEDIGFWMENDRDAAIAAVAAAYEITGGKPVPEKARQVRLK